MAEFASTESQIVVPTGRAFDYGSMSASDADGLRAKADNIRRLSQSSTAQIIELGHELMEVKQQLPHGRFENWVRAECGINIRTAENYIRAAQLAKDKNETVSLLPPGLVYRLASKSAPTEIVEEVLDRAGKGEVIDPREVEDSLRTARRQKAKANQKEKKRKQRGVSAKTRKRLEAEEEKREEKQRLAEERCQQVAVAILERIGDDGVRFFLNAVRDEYVWDIFRSLEALLAAPQAAE
jgi:hypothetical protein